MRANIYICIYTYIYIYAHPHTHTCVFQSFTHLGLSQDQYPEFRRIWEEEMLLIRADDTAFWQMEEPDVKWDPQVICLQT